MAAMSAATVCLPPEAAYRALVTHDTRFDGRLFVGVTSTGVYCRPVCRVRLPRMENCRFYANAASAECAGFRPCLRCRPELAPGLSFADARQTLAQAGALLIEQAVADGHSPTLTEVAARLGVSDRHLRRIFQQVLGVSPLDWLNTQRLLLAKQLLTDTALPVAEVAAAVGFASPRRFQAVWAQHYRLSPSALRRSQAEGSAAPSPCLLLDVPGGSAAMQRFLTDRCLPGVEHWQAPHWRRTLALTHRGQRCVGWFSLNWQPATQQVQVQLSAGLLPAWGAVRLRLRHLLDVDSDTTAADTLLAGLPGEPGTRVPGCVDGFETAVRIVLAQQVSLGAACTLAGRLVARFGEPLATPWPELSHVFPSPQALAQADAADLGALGIFRSRVQAIQALARAVASGALPLRPGVPLEPTLAQLRSLPGVGEWTVQWLALRVLAWPDAFPAQDAALRQALARWQTADPTPAATTSPLSLSAWAERWRPWRSYACMRLLSS